MILEELQYCLDCEGGIDVPELDEGEIYEVYVYLTYGPLKFRVCEVDDWEDFKAGLVDKLDEISRYVTEDIQELDQRTIGKVEKVDLIKNYTAAVFYNSYL